MAQQYLLNDYLFVLFDTKPFMCLEDHKTFLDGRVSGSRNMSIIYKIPFGRPTKTIIKIIIYAFKA